jgi:hypothetical protein
VCYDFPEARGVSSIGVYWFDDAGAGQCRIPKSWRLSWKDGDAWKPVDVIHMDGISKDQWCRMKFKPVKTTALRLEAGLQSGFSGGILEWTVK